MKRKNCSISAITPATVHDRDCDDNLAGRAPRHRPQPQLPRLLGRRRRQPRLVERHLPRRLPGQRARERRRPYAHLRARGHGDDLQPHLQQPGPAPAGHRGHRACAIDEPAAQGPRRRDGRRRTTTSARPPTSSTTPPARPRTGATGSPAASATPSRSATRASTRPTRRRWSASTSAARRPTAQGWAATGRRTGSRRRRRPTRSCTRVIRGTAPDKHTITVSKTVTSETSPVLQTRPAGRRAAALHRHPDHGVHLDGRPVRPSRSTPRPDRW